MAKDFHIGDRVRWAHDGESDAGRVIHMSRLHATVVDVWADWGEQRCEVRWDLDSCEAAKLLGVRIPSRLLSLA
jgi:hypothetical protein